jgi:hypothetical protein
MINRLIGGFVGILLGISLLSPIAQTVNSTSGSGGYLANTTTWGATVLNLVPGFFALSILGIGIAVCYGALRDAGVV